MNSKRYGIILWVFLGLFLFRVVVQLIQSKFSVQYLPPFEAWHSGVLRYHYLVMMQALIIFIYGYICAQFTLERVVPRRATGKIFLYSGLFYGGAMVIRMFIGLFISSSTWFHAYLSIFFHFILASFLIVVGLFHLKYFHLYER